MFDERVGFHYGKREADEINIYTPSSVFVSVGFIMSVNCSYARIKRRNKTKKKKTEIENSIWKQKQKNIRCTFVAG